MLDQLRQHGYRCALASTFALEFLIPSAWYAARHILLNAHPGAVIVLHDGAAERARTVAVLRRVLPALRDRGYRVTTLSELVGTDAA
jgi:peptidoglycan/xylan/chitin deacetylase (PgdA/CDA1 family)